ncbi:hypothetical protein [Paenirhodobacter populi]|uniref:DUF695 domain-containing protein n=1 Tax=Paenirhodobacter populi TaxID=2306993 RepID=A0A443IQC7_9RHOB|nr:hypothetical protein [Sinirhodobacter populi]RWR09176.1 hypothetical protein D2T33_14350 [Sinirhodobacter populi]
MPYSAPEPVASELSAWNNGNGAELEVLSQYEGSYRLSVSDSALLWPKFKLVGPYILREGASAERIAEWEDSLSGDSRGLEAVMNHIHLTDYFLHHDDGLSREVVAFLTRQLCEIHEAKLMWQFPDRPCRVISTTPDDPEELDNYQITFWQKKWEATGG